MSIVFAAALVASLLQVGHVVLRSARRRAPEIRGLEVGVFAGLRDEIERLGLPAAPRLAG